MILLLHSLNGLSVELSFTFELHPTKDYMTTTHSVFYRTRFSISPLKLYQRLPKNVE